jgi:hypothetical protein
MCKWEIPKQYAYIDSTAPPEYQFKRFETPVISDAHLKAVRGMLPHTGEYISVYGWTGWKGGQINAEISKTAVIDGIFLDFDDVDDPQKAIRDAAEVAAYVGHCTGNFSGAKGAHLWITCHPVDLIPDLKGHVIRQFVNNLVDVLPELDTLDFSVVGDTSRVRRIIDSVHPKYKLHAIGLTAEELATYSIDAIRGMAKFRRGLIQVPEPSQWVTDELYRIERDILRERLTRMYDKEQVAGENYRFIDAILQSPNADRAEIFEFINMIETEWRRIRTKNAPKTDGIIGRTPEETWLLKVINIFKVLQRMNSIRPASSKVSTSSSEHQARVHIVHLADECGWTLGEICDIFTGADDYDPGITERMVRSCVGR